MSKRIKLFLEWPLWLFAAVVPAHAQKDAARTGDSGLRG